MKYLFLLLLSTCLTAQITVNRTWYFAQTAGGASGLSVTDNFNRADEALDASANWTSDYGTTSAALSIVSNVVKCDNASLANSMYWSADAFADAQYAQTVVNGDGNDGGASVRGGSGDNYMVNNYGGSITILQFNANSYDTIASQSGDYDGSSTYKITANGTALATFENGSATGMPSGTDASLTSGSAGIFSYGTTLTHDDWAGGDL